jgi:hypothetical protein
MRSTQGFSVDGDDPCNGLVQTVYPLEKAFLKFDWVQASKYPSERIMRWNPIWEFSDGFQPFLFFCAKLFDSYPSLCSTNHATDGKNDDIKQFMLLCSLYAWVFYFGKIACQVQWALVFHVSPHPFLDLILPPPDLDAIALLTRESHLALPSTCKHRGMAGHDTCVSI